ncbi:MAG: sigma 54-interacting transcriptional regulator [Candidatus Wallbacteria bacterium]|nr:sigma 54-interacting transcriptional regulator [Candidatus Wallbacteria bacterium]
MTRPETEKIPAESLEYSTVTLQCGRLVVAEGPDAGRSVRLAPGAQVKVGKGSANDLALTDGAVSAEHLVIRHRPDGFVVQDLGSTNGTFLDGVRVTEAFLGPGSRVRLGRTSLDFAPETDELVIFPSASERFGQLLGKSRKMRQVFGLLERVAAAELAILIEGETGCGKELAARSIHEASPRAGRPYVVFDCARASREFMESELFGHEKGAFTGATDKRTGAFETAHGGTLFIDELGELAPELQPKLLRALEEREVRPLGSTRSRQVDVRIVAATNRDLAAMVREGRFREDLYFRLAVVSVKLPPLRERRDDVPLLVQHLLSVRRSPGVTPEALAVLAGQPWRGNVRELANVLDRAVAIAAGETIRPGHLMLLGAATQVVPPQAAAASGAGGLAGLTMEEIEREAIRQTFAACGNNKAATARSLGIASSTLFEKMKKFGLDR